LFVVVLEFHRDHSPERAQKQPPDISVLSPVIRVKFRLVRKTIPLAESLFASEDSILAGSLGPIQQFVGGID
jgi:hypothetical protein